MHSMAASTTRARVDSSFMEASSSRRPRRRRGAGGAEGRRVDLLCGCVLGPQRERGAEPEALASAVEREHVPDRGGGGDVVDQGAGERQQLAVRDDVVD